MIQNTQSLPAEKILTLIASASSSGSVRRLAPSGSATQYPIVPIAAGETLTLGPFVNDRVYEILTDRGEAIAYTIATPDESVGAHAMGAVVHGANASVARPSGFASVTWIGSVEPTNMADGDLWEEVGA